MSSRRTTNLRGEALIPKRRANKVLSSSSETMASSSNSKGEGATPPVTFPSTNPYHKLTREILETIARERDFAFYRPNRRVELSLPEMAEQLFQFDHILPEWLAQIQARNINNLSTLTLPQVYVFGALRNVNFVGLPSPEDLAELAMYIRVAIALEARDSPQPKLRPLLRCLSRSYVEYFVTTRLNLDRQIIPFASIEMLRNALLNNDNAFDMEVIQSAMRRFSVMSTHKYRDILGRLYGITSGLDRAETWRKVVRKQPHPMEQVIIHLDSYTPAQITKTFGMVVPLSYSGRVDTYIRENIPHYATLLTRQQIEPAPLEVLAAQNKDELRAFLRLMTDNEIHTHIGIYVPYQDRKALIKNTSKAILSQKHRFMYPCVRSATRSTNTTTMLYTDITDIQTFMVCYGTALKYYTYELQELIGAFHLDEQTGLMDFRKPEAPTKHFAIDEIEGLKTLLQCFDRTDEITILIQRINQGLIFAREKLGYDTVARNGLNRLSVTGRNWVREFLRQLFHIGMYMRRWQGPGHPYPLREIDTKREWDPMHKVQDELLRARGTLDQMGRTSAQYCMGLRVCEYKTDGSLDQHSNNLEYEWGRVTRGEFCIRMASSKFVGTSLHFLRALFQENIEGVDTTLVARIL